MGLVSGLLYGWGSARTPAPAELAGMASAQKLAYAGARAIFAELREGWTEAQAATLLEVWLQDNGVRRWFHKPFAWFGERSRFDGMSRWRDFLPSGRRLDAGDAVILDAAPILKGAPADIGYSASFGPHEGVASAREFLAELRGAILELFCLGAKGSGLTGGEICEAVARRIKAAGYEPVHHRYPGAVLGHRLHATRAWWRPPTGTPFGWEAVSGIVGQGVLPDLLNEEHQGKLQGAWAIEPHLGGLGFGCKFEEILVVEEGGARWLAPETPW